MVSIVMVNIDRIILIGTLWHDWRDGFVIWTGNDLT